MSFRTSSRAALAALTILGVASPLSVAASQQPAPTKAARAESASDRFAQIQRRYRNALSFRLEFTQTVSNPLTGTTSKAQGVLLRKKPNLFALNFSEPATGDRVVGDGQAVWVYLPSSVPNQVIKMPMTSERAAVADPLGHLLTATTDQYKVADGGKITVDGKQAYALILTPARSDGLFTKATVWSDGDGIVLKVETTESNGVERRITITNQALNVSIPAGTFSFTPPRNVRVVSQGFALGG